MKLELPKKKLYIARALRYVGLAGAIISCLFIPVMDPPWLILVLIYGFIAVMLAGQYWIIALYKCPRCEVKLLYSSDRRRVGFETNCPEYCPKCGERIIVKITDE